MNLLSIIFNKVLYYEFMLFSTCLVSMIIKHIYILEFIREFINVFEEEVQKLKADQLQLGTCSHLY
jgi:hypothetical protein